MVWYWMGGVAGVLALVGLLYALHRLALHLERRGLLYYRQRPGSARSVTCALRDLDSVIQPSVQHVIEAEESQRIVRDDTGGE